MIEIELSKSEVDNALDFVHRMREDKKEHSVTDKKFDSNNTSWAVNLMGYLGELAVAKAYDVNPDTRVLTGGDEGHDLIINGKKIQVKTTTTSKLIFNSKELFSADYAILVQLLGDKRMPHLKPQFIIWGCISKEKFLDVCYEQDFGYGIRFVCNINDLSQELNAITVA